MAGSADRRGLVLLGLLGLLAAALVIAGRSAGDDDQPLPSASEDSSAEYDRRQRELGRELERELRPALLSVNASPRRACPPPAILACRTAIALSGELDDNAARVQRRLRMVLPGALRRAGFQRLELRSWRRGDQRAGVASSGPEVLARWRIQGRRLELATGGLELGSSSAQRTTR